MQSAQEGPVYKPKRKKTLQKCQRTPEHTRQYQNRTTTLKIHHMHTKTQGLEQHRKNSNPNGQSQVTFFSTSYSTRPRPHSPGIGPAFHGSHHAIHILGAKEFLGAKSLEALHGLVAFCGSECFDSKLTP